MNFHVPRKEPENYPRSSQVSAETKGQTFTTQLWNIT